MTNKSKPKDPLLSKVNETPKTKPEESQSKEAKLLPPYNVILLNDEYHTYDYVIKMLMMLFHYSHEKAYQLANSVHMNNRAIVFTTHKELAELRREQIQNFGVDEQITECKGSMSAIIEPVA